MILLSNIYADPLVDLLGWDWLANIGFASIIIRLFLAIICGGVIGVERASKRHAAGFRTYILVSLGAAMAGATNQFIIEFFGSGDGARLGAQVISGIGFLCAGSILVTSKNQIKGLTTSAGLWACGCMGLAVGLGYYTIGLIGGISVYLVLVLFPPIENYFTQRTKSFSIHVELDSRPNLKDLISYLRNNDCRISNIEHNIAYASSGLSVYTIAISIDKKSKLTHTQVLENIKQLEYVNFAEIID